MSFIALAIGGVAAAGIGAAGSYFSSQTAADAQRQAAGTIAAGRDSSIQTIMNLLSPQTNAIGTASENGEGGTGILGQLTKLLTPGKSMTDTLHQLPGFQFLQDTGNAGVTAQGTTRGLGGNTLAAGANFGTGLAESQWGNLVSPLQQLFGQLSSTANNEASSISGIQTGAAQNIAQTQVGAGQSQAAGITGMSNAATGAINNGLNLMTLNQLLGKGGNQAGGLFAQQNPYYTMPQAGKDF